MSLSMSCSQLSLDVAVCNLLILVASTFISLINVDHTCMRKTSFPQNAKLAVVPCIIILLSPLGCLRVHSKYSLACHWLFYWPGMKEQDMMRNTTVTNMRARTLPSQNACRVKADGMGPSYRRRFPLQCYTQDLTIMVLLV